MTKPAAAGYARLSDKRERSSSIPMQKKRIAEYCDRYGLDLLETFVDDGKSGWTFDRPGFKQLEAFCKKHPEIKYLIIVHFDRFSRADPIDAMVKERHFREKLKVKVLMITEPPETDTDNPMYQMMRFMQAFAANQERSRIVERTRSGMRYRMLQGHYSALAPFGYKNVRDESGKASIIIDESRAKIIKNIYALYLKGCAIEEIRKIAIAQGFTIKGNSIIQSVLTNPVYAGMINVPAFDNHPAKLVKASHKAIVSEDTYWQVQKMMNPRKFIPQKRNEVPLRGVLKCQVCGRLMTAAPSKGRSGKHYWYYFCTHDRKENYSAIKVHGWLDDILEAISIKGDYFTMLKEKLSATISSMISNQTRDLMQANLSISSLERSIEQIESKYLTGNVSEESYKKVINERRAHLSELTSKREFLKLKSGDYLGRLDLMLAKASNLRTLYNEMDIISKQLFIKQVFGTDLKTTPKGLRTTFLHPVFVINESKINELPLIIETKLPSKEGETTLVSPHGTLPNTWEFLESVLALFAA